MVGAHDFKSSGLSWVRGGGESYSGPCIFLTYDLPEKVTSDNGPPFQSHNHEIAEYIKVKDIIHC